MVLAQMFSNTSLTCSALSWQTCFYGPVTLTWHYRNRTLQNSTKYTIIVEHKNNNCERRLLKAESTLKIFNVTDEDAGEYFCQLKCSFLIRVEKDSIALVTFVKPGGETKIHNFCFLLSDAFLRRLYFYRKIIC